LVIFKNAQAADFLGQINCIGLNICLGDAEQYQQPGSNFADNFIFYCDSCEADPLHNGAHRI
jgi:hypothetical protein